MPYDNLITREMTRMASIKKDVDPDRTDLPAGTEVVPPHLGHEHGYYGARPDPEPRSSFTVAGVTANAVAQAAASGSDAASGSGGGGGGKSPRKAANGSGSSEASK